jgi:hypothetical protein
MATKRKYKKKALPVRLGEQVTKERRRKHGGIKTEILGRDLRGKVIIRRQRAAAECTLDVYSIRQTITDEQYQAGLKFRIAYLRAVLRIRVSDIGYGCRGDDEMSVILPLYSEQLLRKAYQKLSLEQRSVIISVCGHDEWAGGIYRLHWLRSGLDVLAQLWGFST